MVIIHTFSYGREVIARTPAIGDPLGFAFEPHSVSQFDHAELDIDIFGLL